jgi:predicted ABC-type ATPase
LAAVPVPSTPQPRLRVFAGPNGSGKSTIIGEVKAATPNGRPIDFGLYINADEIARELRQGTFSFQKYEVQVSRHAFLEFAAGSGLLYEQFNLKDLSSAFSLSQLGEVKLKKAKADERLAQLIARFLREELLRQRKRFTFKTVFSHPSNLDIMRRAADAGYKVYLYFVATESP